MKKLTKLITICLAAIMLLAITGTAYADKAALTATLETAAKMTDDELYAEAKNEKGTMQIYSTTSLAANTVESFLAVYPDLNVAISDVGEADMFTKLSTEVNSATAYHRHGAREHEKSSAKQQRLHFSRQKMHGRYPAAFRNCHRNDVRKPYFADNGEYSD